MLLQTQRQTVADYGRRLVRAGLTAGTGGNLSVRDAISGAVAVSPSGMDYEDITAADAVVLSPAGAVLEGARKPTSETALHLAFYAARADVFAVVHTHSPAATALACLRRSLPPMSYLLALTGRDSVPCAPYRDFGSQALAEAAVKTADGGGAVLLASHGLVCVGADMAAAFALAEQVEFCADVYLRCLAAGREPALLTAEEMARARERLGTYGQNRGA